MTLGERVKRRTPGINAELRSKAAGGWDWNWVRVLTQQERD